MNRQAEAAVNNVNVTAAANTSTSATPATTGSASPTVPAVPTQSAPGPVDTTAQAAPSAAESKSA
jgi:hypothetical protein